MKQAAFAAVVLSALGWAQQSPFTLLVITPNQGATAIQNGGSIGFLATVGQSQKATVQVTYTGSGQVTISDQPSIFGSTTFHPALVSAPPIKLTTGASTSFTIEFTPTSAAPASAQLTLPYVETGGANGQTNGNITFALQGTASSFALSYVLQVDQNVVPLQSGGLILFPPTVLGATSQAALNITNLGSGAGVVTGISITGANFRIQGVPLLPATVASGQNLQVLILYTPTTLGTDTGQITLTFASGSPVTINLSGSSTAANLIYQIISSDPPVTIIPGGTITLPDTKLNTTSSIILQIANAGTASGTINTVNLAGQAFQLSGVTALPQVLAPGASTTLTISFTPTQPGPATGNLIVNSTAFKLAGTGLGAVLTFSYVAGGSTITLSSSNPSIVFSPVMISQSAQLPFTIKNTGTLATTISNIGIGQNGSPYSLLNLPPLPVTLDPNAEVQFLIKFSPTTVGFSNGTLLLDGTSIGLIGSGTQPPALPPYTLTGPSGIVNPQTQSTVGLSLASPYPVALVGQLTMSVSGTLPADPAAQFSTGGRTVSFVIPAGQTAAQFGSQGTQIGLQTGTTASSFTIAPTFATQAGNVDLTPASPQTLKFSIASAAPTLVSLILTAQSANTLTIQINGYTTPRNLSSLGVQFTTNSGYSMPTSQFTIDLKQISTSFFQGAASQSFGGQFRLNLPFTFTLPTGLTLQAVLSSVSVTATNDTGTSNSIQAKIQ